LKQFTDEQVGLNGRSHSTRGGGTSRAQSKTGVVLELLVAVLIGVGGVVGFVPVSSTPFLLILAWISLRVRHATWRSIGLFWPTHSQRAIAVGVVAGTAYQLASLYAVEPALSRMTGARPDASIFASLARNVPMLVITLTIVWTVAAFGEELVFRGYLFSRLRDLLGDRSIVLPGVIASLAFGLTHVYQGASGVLDNALAGLVFAAAYSSTRDNLMAPIIAHGTMDTIGAVLMFLRKYPGQ
jgi:membrane protease YdiL (CAAX protease family)